MGAGSSAARDELMPLVYQELHRRAAAYLRRERRDHTLQPTALVNEAYLRLVKQDRAAWQNRAQFFGVASEIMRRILVDHARGGRMVKRSGRWVKVTLDDRFAEGRPPDIDVLALDEALRRLSEFDPRKSRIAELRFFGGLSLEETGHVLGISVATVERDWQVARAWLYAALKGQRTSMTPDRWRQVTEIFHAALARDAAARDAFLRDACQGDPSLRSEVDALVAAHGDAGSVRPATHSSRGRPPSLAGHSTRGRIKSKAARRRRHGRGLSRTRYRAGRPVAIKILPGAWLADPDRRARLDKEARLLAALNHPHVAAIYGVVEADGVRGLVLELVEGATLAERLIEGPLPLTEALNVATQIADALDATHEKGIVHRDLKPANIKITPRRRRQGVGLRGGEGPSAESSPRGPEPPTDTAGQTGDEVIVGTAAYMSPEQARGKPVDKRADIWAFGCVLYEMLSGRRAFDGETLTDVLAAIIDREPEWTALPATCLPPCVISWSAVSRRIRSGDCAISATRGSSSRNRCKPTRGRRGPRQRVDPRVRPLRALASRWSRSFWSWRLRFCRCHTSAPALATLHRTRQVTAPIGGGALGRAAHQLSRHRRHAVAFSRWHPGRVSMERRRGRQLRHLREARRSGQSDSLDERPRPGPASQVVA